MEVCTNSTIVISLLHLSSEIVTLKFTLPSWMGIIPMYVLIGYSLFLLQSKSAKYSMERHVFTHYHLLVVIIYTITVCQFITSFLIMKTIARFFEILS